MSEYSFELLPFTHPAHDGWTGPVGDFGVVTVHYERTVSPKEKIGQARLYGDGFPDVLFRGSGPGMPTLHKAHMFVGGEPVELSYNARGLRRSARALRLTQGDRSHTYTSAGVGKEAELCRTGVKITVGPGRRVDDPHKGLVTAGQVQGPADPVDLAIAIIFEAVDTSSLTLGGAMVMAPLNFLQRQTDGGGS
ncbi:hypothetical protein [Streptomyces zagrosensis]|uniref:Uncharacterized protein n=1 Tax=Streptomyces zagrosensis TaxID=1042984 RepID=A0A7W9UXI7_9ACTN|nr:hypothetical protein [Streptomyces zagrosensis]MBB5934682.1 hypothetical protein [Streptomyces zagrosensis]